ncbi:hypothetical protein P308_22095 [Pseudomonas piscis]|nr:hypothetical protein P308_22095 [Pseudomonas piscis]
MGFARRQARLLLRRQAVELQALLVQVVAVGDLPEQLGLARGQALGAEYERLAHRQEVGLDLERVVAGLRQGGEQHEQQDEQSTHGQALNRCKLRAQWPALINR